MSRKIAQFHIYNKPGAHQMELPSPLISWVNPFPNRVINRTIFFCNSLESHECTCCLLSFLYFHWLFALLARETSSGNRSIYKSTRERVYSKGLCVRLRLHLMGSWTSLLFWAESSKSTFWSNNNCSVESSISEINVIINCWKVQLLFFQMKINVRLNIGIDCLEIWNFSSRVQLYISLVCCAGSLVRYRVLNTWRETCEWELHETGQVMSILTTARKIF